MKTIAFFNNKGGVGKTSLVYHLSWMYADLGLKVIAADLDPQSNLTAMFLDEIKIETLWPEGSHPNTIMGVIEPIKKGTGDIVTHPNIEDITENIGLLPGDMGLAEFEDKLSDAWPRCLDQKEDAFRIVSAFYRSLLRAALDKKAELVLIDVGPNLGAINRSAMISAQYIVIPLAPDIYSLQGLKNLGPTLRDWRIQWGERLEKKPKIDLELPEVWMETAGYVVLQHSVRLDRPTKAYDKWANQIPNVYRKYVLEEKEMDEQEYTPINDKYCLSMIKHYRSLMPMAMDAHKPIFKLQPADGAFGAHVQAVRDCYVDFKNLALNIANVCNLEILKDLENSVPQQYVLS